MSEHPEKLLDDLTSLLTSDHPDAVKWRVEQANVDADIEGLPRDPKVDQFVASMQREGRSLAEQREGLRRYFQEPERSASAAE